MPKTSVSSLPKFILIGSCFMAQWSASAATLKVIAHVGEHGVSNATVTITTTNGYSNRTSTNGSGNVIFENVPAGKFKLVISADGCTNFQSTAEGGADETIDKSAGNYTYDANMQCALDPHAPVLMENTFLLSELSQNVPQFTSRLWPNLARIASNQLPFSSYFANIAESAGDTVILSPRMVMSKSLDLSQSDSNGLKPIMNFNTLFVAGHHTYTIGKDPYRAKDENRVSPNLTETSSFDTSAQAFSVNLVPSGHEDIYLTVPEAAVAFEDSDGFCVDSAGKPITDPSVMEADGCHNDIDNQVMGFREDIVSKFVKDGMPMVRLHYQLKKYWYIVTSTVDGKTTSNPADMTVSVEYLPLVVSGKSGHAIISKDHFSSTADILDQWEDADGKPIKLDPPKTYLRLSNTLFQKLQSIDVDDEGKPNNEVEQKTLVTSGAQHQSSLAIALSYLYHSPTNRELSWIKLPYPEDQKVGFDITLDPTTSEIRYHAVKFAAGSHGGVRAQPDDHFADTFAEFEKNAPSLGTGKLATPELLNLILEAMNAKQDNN